MPNWIDIIDSHQLFDEIRSARTALDALRRKLQNLGAEEIEQLERIEFVVQEVERRTNQADPNLVPMAPLNKMQQVLAQINSNLASVQSTGELGALKTAYNQIENILIHLATIPVAISAEDLDAIRESAISLRRSAGQHMRNLEEKNSQVLERARELDQVLTLLKGKIDHQTKRTSDLFESHERRHQEQQQKWEAQLELESKQREKRNLEAIQEFDTLWKDLLKSRQEDYESLHAVTEEKLEILELEFSEKARDVLTEIGKRRKDAEEIVGVITDHGMTGGYKQIADEEKIAALVWRVIAALSLSGLVVFAVILFNVTLKDDFEVSMPLTLTRVFIAGAVAVLAGYAARQAEKHDRSQRRLRKMQLELSALSPFFHEFPGNETLPIKKELAMKMFGQSDQDDRDGSGKESHSKLLETALDALKELISKS